MAKDYDFVIIGGGTSGLVVATRLSEDPNISVLVVEAGADHHDDIRVRTPGLHFSLWNSEADWGFRTEPQTELNGRKIHLTQVRALGGSSTINVQVFVPPSRTIIDSWESLGNPGWNWETMMPYYAKSYSLKGPEGELAKHLGTEWAAKNNETSGPIQVSYPWQLEDDPMPNAWLDTFKALGYEMKEDPFSGAPVGAFASLHSVDPVKKERSDAATTYYGRTVDRKNLTLLTGCLVEKILFGQASNELIATGIQYQQDGATKIAKARKEVILAAGSLQSPKMLELSGIGNSKLLNSHGIEVFIDNPNVGENLQDHLLCYISFEAKDSIKTLDDLIRRDPKVLDDATKEYNTSRTGILSHSTVIGYAYLPVTEFLSAEGKMKLKRLLDTYIHDEDRPAAKGNFGVARKILESENEASAAFIHTASQADVYDMPFGPAPGKFVTIGVMLSQPLSTGYVHITSPDPTVRPIIDPRYLSHPIDLEIFARHVQYINTIASSEPFCSAVLKEGGRRKGGENAYSTDLESVKEWVRRTGHSMWHPSSTCAMLPRDKGGVVDERLRVYGARGLRVVDASVMPIVTRANIQSSVYAVAERAADIIKIDHGLDIK